MKESKYNFHLRDNTGMIIYNAKSDEVIALNPQLADIYEERRENPVSIKEIHPDLYAYLVEKGVFVGKALDETADYIDMRKKEEGEAQEYTIIINPTLACNMKCWYCYETHNNMPAMNVKVKMAITALIKRLSEAGKITRLNLSFFGGEPLLYFDRIVIDIINEAKQLCHIKGIKLSIHFTTNAFLLTETILAQLKGTDTSFQITIDGNRHIHDTIRKTKSDQPTYSTIVRNIHTAVSMGFPVGVRFNYTSKSLPSFIDVLSDFQHLPSARKELLNFTFQRVWQDHEGDLALIEKKVEEIEQAFEKANLHINPSNDFFVPYCYADSRNTVVINYNGDLYKCTARDFSSKNKEGVLTSDGNLKWNERNNKRMSIRFGSDFCRKCIIYPICHGGCSQMKLEAGEREGCPKGFDEAMILNILKGRAMFILERYKQRNRQA